MSTFNIRRTRLFAESWNVAWRKKPVGAILTDLDTPFSVIKNAYRYWAADPFVIEHDGKAYIFAELYDYIRCRGVLGYCTLTDEGPGKWIPVIVESHHLSYPCLMKHQERIYLMPESGAGKELCVYEAVSFPDKWRKIRVVRENVNFADTTPLPGSGRKYALTHDVENPYNPKLLLIDLSGEAPDIAVNTADPFTGRPAGHFFEYKGKWIRPAQYSENPNEGYGKGLVFYRCGEDQQSSYKETEIRRFSPEDLRYEQCVYLDGMHTYNASEHYEVIDIKTRRFNLLNFVMRLLGKLFTKYPVQ